MRLARVEPPTLGPEKGDQAPDDRLLRTVTKCLGPVTTPHPAATLVGLLGFRPEYDERERVMPQILLRTRAWGPSLILPLQGAGPYYVPMPSVPGTSTIRTWLEGQRARAVAAADPGRCPADRNRPVSEPCGRGGPPPGRAHDARPGLPGPGKRAQGANDGAHDRKRPLRRRAALDRVDMTGPGPSGALGPSLSFRVARIAR